MKLHVVANAYTTTYRFLLARIMNNEFFDFKKGGQNNSKK